MKNDSVKFKILNFELSFLTLIFTFLIKESLVYQLPMQRL